MTIENTAIDCVFCDGRPEARPDLHASVSAAKTEAERLARVSPGDTFAVYEMVMRR